MRSSLLAALLLALTIPMPAGAQSGDAERLTLRPERGTIFTIEGLYPQPPGEVCPARRRPPLRAKYRGTLEVVRERGGTLRLINDLTFSQYLRGLAEVPLSWPREALRAQVIAARSYAIDAYQRGRADAGERGYHICATDQCQVYRGATVELGAFGERWRAAVRDTAGQVLRHGGDVIQAFYFSTSDGRTRRSFPGGTPQPWLPGVSGQDADAPLARWTAPVQLGHLTAILRDRDLWSGGPIATVRDAGDDVEVRGGGHSVRLSKRDLRIVLNDEASCAYPRTYPNETGSAEGGRLPQTIPSSSYRVAVRDGAVVFRGSGWGHFVGMSQWGARSLAARGRSATQILGHYYGPAQIARISEPSSLRVLAAEDMRRVRIEIDGDATVTTDAGGELGGSEFEVRGGSELTVLRGIGPGGEPVLTVLARPTGAGPPGSAFDVTLSRPARVRVLLRETSGEETVLLRERSYEHGEHRLEVAPPRLSAGDAIVVEAYDGLDRVRAVGFIADEDAEAPAGGGGAGPALIALGGAAIVAALLALRWRLSRR